MGRAVVQYVVSEHLRERLDRFLTSHGFEVHRMPGQDEDGDALPTFLVVPGDELMAMVDAHRRSERVPAELAAMLSLPAASFHVRHEAGTGTPFARRLCDHCGHDRISHVDEPGSTDVLRCDECSCRSRVPASGWPARPGLAYL